MASPSDGPTGRETIAEVRLSHGRLVLAETLAANPELHVELTAQTPDTGDDWILFFTVAGDALDGFDDSLRDDPTVAEPTVLAATGVHRVYRARVVDCVRISGMLGELGFRVLGVTSVDDDWCYRVQGSDRAALARFFERCQERGIAFQLERFFRTPGVGPATPRGLTDGQVEAVRLASEGGYFAVPRRMTLADLAGELGVSRQAASERLRRAVGNLLDETF